jgi:3-oxoacyl-[acyl-carrier protein] reductase
VAEQEQLSGKVVAVTGAGSPRGLGFAMAKALAAAGARVAMMDLDARALGEACEEVCSSAGEQAAGSWVVDVSDAGAATRVVDEVVETYGRLDVLVNNAGIGVGAGKPRGPFWEIAPEVWERIAAVNYLGAVHMAQAAVRHMLGQGSGTIVGVTTSLDNMWVGWNTAYGASKAAHEAFVASIALNLKDTGVTANVLVPGGIADTNLIGSEFTGDRSALIRPEVMQAPIVWLASDEAKAVSGKRFIATLWDESLPVDERLEKAGAPAAWQPLGRRSVWVADDELAGST